MPTKKKATKKKAAKKKAAKKSTASNAAERMRKRVAHVRTRLVDKLASSSTSIDDVSKKLERVTGKPLTRDEQARASLKLAESVLRGKRR